MELRQLMSFQAVADTGSFTRAAEQLGYVQSNVTAHIQALEHELAVVLFDRLGRRVQLTSAGQRLLEYANQILALASEAHSMVSAGSTSKIVISAPESLCAYRLPALLRETRQRLPQVQVAFRPIPANLLRQQVLAGTIDVAFSLEPQSENEGLYCETLAQEPIVLLAPPEHYLAQQQQVVVSDLQAESLLLTEAGCAYRVRFEQVLRAAAIVPQQVLEFSSVEAIKQCVVAGMGIAVLPQITVARELAQGDLVALPWASDDLSMSSQMIWHAKRWCSPTMSEFLALARECLSQSSTANQ
jgi:DNA-binding transcriptional LysR family regulator